MRVLNSRKTSMGNTLTSTPAMLLLPIRETYVHAPGDKHASREFIIPLYRIKRQQRNKRHPRTRYRYKSPESTFPQTLRVVASRVTAKSRGPGHQRNVPARHP